MRIDSSRTFGDLMLDLAIRLGVAPTDANADKGHVLPADSAQLGTVKDALWAASRQVAKESDWAWLCPYFTQVLDPDGEAPECVEGDCRRYLMPSDIASGSLGRVSWASASSGGFVLDTSPERVEVRIATFPGAVGKPELVSVWPDTVGEGNQRTRYVMTVYPKPDHAYTIKGKFRREFNVPQELAERPQWPQVCDEAVLAYALVHLKRLDKMKSGVDLMSLLADYADKLQSAIKIDVRLRGKTLGTLGDSVRTVPAYPGVMNQQGTYVVPAG